MIVAAKYLMLNLFSEYFLKAHITPRMSFQEKLRFFFLKIWKQEIRFYKYCIKEEIMKIEKVIIQQKS